MTSDWLTPNSFRRLLHRAVLIPLALLMVLAAVFLVQIVYLISVMRWIDHTDRVLAKTNGLLKLFVDGETGVRGYLITRDPAFLEPYRAEECKAGQAFDELIELVSDNPSQVDRLKQLRDDHAEWQTLVRGTLASQTQNKEPAQNQEGKRRMDRLREQVAQFIQVEETLRIARIESAERTTWLIVAASLGLAFVLGGILGYLTRLQLLQVSAQYREALGKVEAQAESLRRSVLRFESLHKIDRSILAAESVAELASAALKRMEQVVPADDAFIALIGPDEQPTQVITRTDQISPLSETDPRRKQIRIALAGLDRVTHADGKGIVGGRTAVPLQVDGRRIGILILVDSAPFSDEHQQITREVASQLAIAFQQAQLREKLHQYAATLEQRVKERTRELEQALENVKQLQGLVPICAWCKKVRDDQNYWHEVEQYVADHTDARFSHGICPACFEANMKFVKQTKAS